MPDGIVTNIYKVASSSDAVQDNEDSDEIDLSSLNISDYGDLQTFTKRPLHKLLSNKAKLS